MNKRIAGAVLLSGLFAIVGPAVTASQAQGDPVPPVQFIYRSPESNDGFFGCAGLVGVDVAVQGCSTFAPTANDFVGSLEFQPLPALRLGRLQVPLVPEVAVQYVVPNVTYMHFRDGANQVFYAPDQASLRFAIGYDTYFYDRHLWGDRRMLKIGGACLLTESIDRNARREGCDAADLDNWFIKALYAKTLYVGTDAGERELGYLQASVYWEMPDHDFASKPDQPGAIPAYNDDGLDVTYADVTFLARVPSFGGTRLPWTVDIRGGGGVGLASQVESATALHGDLLATLNVAHNLAVTGGAKYNVRRGSFSGGPEDNRFWTFQAYAQWRPDFVVFWDHRY